MKPMERVDCKGAYYVKLGRNGIWEEFSIRKSVIRIGWANQTITDINSGKWSKIQKQLEKEAPDKGTATRDCRALKMLCESTPNDIWITFHRSQLWWCRVGEQRIRKDNISKYRRVQGWKCKNIFGEPLITTLLPGKLAKLQGFRGTICRVKEVDELIRLINRQHSSEYMAILHAKEDLCRHVEQGIQKLHWKDFETLVDLVFRATGWRRISILGETMKFSDIELEDPITGDMYQVQVKSAASLKDFREYTNDFASGSYRKLFFVVHTPEKNLREFIGTQSDSVEIILPKRLAEMVIELGLLNWLMKKIQ